MPVTEAEVLRALELVPIPGARSLAQSGRLTDIAVRDGVVMFSIEVSQAEAPMMETVRAAAERALSGLPGVKTALVGLTAARDPSAAPPPRPPPQRQPAKSGVPGVRRIIAVASGKGGVGKSTTACNLALALSSLGLRVGMLDADIYGPSQPKLFGLSGKPRVLEGKTLEPLERFGVKVMSIGFLVEEETAMIWRGPMVMSAITQLLREVAWGELDVLVVDMPPGTGDAQLTLAQQTPLTGAVIVSTPQDLALIDARRGVAMFAKVHVPVLGVVENMSSFCCPECGHVSPIFGHGGARAEAARMGVPFLGEIPLDMAIRETSDEGLPLVAVSPEGPHAKAYIDIARKVRDLLDSGAEQRPAPRIIVE